MHFLKTAVAALAILVGAGVASAEDFTIPVDGDFWEEDVTWTNMGRAYELRWYVYERNGQLTVCGAGKFVDVSNKMQTIELLRKGAVMLDGRPLVRNLSFFTRLKSNADLASAKATCRDTGVKAGKNSKVSLDISGHARF